MTHYPKARADRDVSDPSMRLDDWIANEPRPVRSGGEHGRAGCPTSPQVLAEAAIKAALEGVEGVEYLSSFAFSNGTIGVKISVDVTLPSRKDIGFEIGYGLLDLSNRLGCPEGGEV